MSFSVFVAATKQDWIDVFGEVAQEVRFYELGPTVEERRTSSALEDLPGLGECSTGRHGDPTYFGLLLSTNLLPVRVQCLDGTIVYSLDGRQNPDHIMFSPGGVFRESHFIAGELLASCNEGALAVMIRRVIGRIRRRFERGNFFYIGPECFRLYNCSRIFAQNYLASPDPKPGINTCYPAKKR